MLGRKDFDVVPQRQVAENVVLAESPWQRGGDDVVV